MRVDLSYIKMDEEPVLILKNQNGDVICPIKPALNFEADFQYNEVSTISFDVPRQYDGEEVGCYDKVVGTYIIEWKNIGQFILVNPKITSDGLKEIKSCEANSLEYEFTHKTITLENSTYNFYNSVMTDTVMAYIMEKMPGWSIGGVANGLVGKYRTFEIDNENLYDFMKSTLQESYSCVFEFDTLNRQVYVVDATEEPAVKPVYLSTNNLITELDIEEQSDEIITVLDVNGADGVDIRDVNPMGENKIYNLDYFMDMDYPDDYTKDNRNFSGTIRTKWQSWKSNFATQQTNYYNKSMIWASLNMSLLVAQNALVELNTEYATLESQLKVWLDYGATSGEDVSEEVAEVKEDMEAKQTEIDNKETEITTITTNRDAALADMQTIINNTKFSAFFTSAELLVLDKYFIEDAIQESSFVEASSTTYANEDNYEKQTNVTFSISDAEVTETVLSDVSQTFYSVVNGSLTVSKDTTSDYITATIIKATSDVTDGTTDTHVTSFYLSEGTIGDDTFDSATLVIMGDAATVTHSDTSLSIASGASGTATIYLTENVSDYQKYSIEYELYDYGAEILADKSSPMYSFDISSQNFIALDDFVAFKNNLVIGNKCYLDNGDAILTPIVTGITLSFEDVAKLDISFGSTYDINDSTYSLKDLTEETITMGKKVDLNQYSYSKFIDSGANTQVKEFMDSSLDVAKNAIMSSESQNVSWDSNGLRLRKTNSSGGYEDNQIWMSNNSIMLTEDNWDTASVGIGEFYDSGLEQTVYGVIAPMIVGTMIAGSSLIIESSATDTQTGNSKFVVDSGGAVLNNSKFNIIKDITSSSKYQILLDPAFGIVTGVYPVITTDESGSEIIDTDNAKFYVDTSGNLHFTGTLEGATGIFTGALNVGTAYTYSGVTHYPFEVSSTGTFTAGNLSNNKYLQYNYTSGNLTIKGGTITGGDVNIGGSDNSNFVVSSAGDVTAKGTLLVSSTGTTSADSYMYYDSNGDLTVKGGNITGGSLNIGGSNNDNFVVTTSGNVTAKGTLTVGDTSTSTYLQYASSGLNIVGGEITGGSLGIGGTDNDNFVVTNLGNVTAKGTLTVGDTSTSTYLQYNSSGLAVYGGTITGGSLNIGGSNNDNFVVTTSGNMTAKGTLLVSSTGTTSADSYMYYDSNGDLTVKGGNITGGSFETTNSLYDSTLTIAGAGLGFKKETGSTVNLEGGMVYSISKWGNAPTLQISTKDGAGVLRLDSNVIEVGYTPDLATGDCEIDLDASTKIKYNTSSSGTKVQNTVLDKWHNSIATFLVKTTTVSNYCMLLSSYSYTGIDMFEKYNYGVYIHKSGCYKISASAVVKVTTSGTVAKITLTKDTTATGDSGNWTNIATAQHKCATANANYNLSISPKLVYLEVGNYVHFAAANCVNNTTDGCHTYMTLEYINDSTLS